MEHDLLVLNALKESLNNPDSFQLVNASRLSNGDLCITFRGTNAFNAIMTETKAVDWGGKIVDSGKCSWESGKNVTVLKHYIK